MSTRATSEFESPGMTNTSSSSLSSSFLFTDRIQTPDSSSFAEQQSHPQSHHLITVPTTGCSLSVSIFITIFHSNFNRSNTSIHQ
ncbi:hypothetical protein HanPI659440_Chr14g0564631 [Helianthus annuus]|nr:hypothetical protein HanPI659440_Chr14g0564631 [Helianthus annuus]